MARITAPLVFDKRMSWSTYQLSVDGIQFSSITEETGIAAVERVIAYCEPIADEIKSAYLAKQAATQANIEAIQRGDNGKIRPEHKSWERLIDKIMSSSGVKDS